MNGHKSKALRRAAKATAQQFPAVHNMRASYSDIVRQKIQTFEVPDENLLQKGVRALGRLIGRKSKPKKTKLVERVVNETRTTVMSSGWRFIQQRLKNAIRRKEARLVQGSIVPYNTTRAALRAQLGIEKILKAGA